MKHPSAKPLALFLLILTALACNFGRAPAPTPAPQPILEQPSVAAPTETSGLPAGCGEASGQPNDQYLGDSDARGGSDAAYFFTDASARITAQAPMFWQCDGRQQAGTLTLSGAPTPFTAANLTLALDLEQFNAYGDGLSVSISGDWAAPGGDPRPLLEAVAERYAVCTPAGLASYASSAFEGFRQDYQDCGSGGGSAIVYALAPRDDPSAYMVLAELRYTSGEAMANLRDIMKNTTINP